MMFLGYSTIASNRFQRILTTHRLRAHMISSFSYYIEPSLSRDWSYLCAPAILHPFIYRILPYLASTKYTILSFRIEIYCYITYTIRSQHTHLDLSFLYTHVLSGSFTTTNNHTFHTVLLHMFYPILLMRAVILCCVFSPTVSSGLLHIHLC